MFAGRHHRRRSTRAVHAAAQALVACACWVIVSQCALAQQSGAIPFLTVPSGAPPAAPAAPTVSIEQAISAALQATGAAGAPAPPAPAAGGARPNPFTTSAPTAGAAGAQSLLLPFNPAQAAENVKVTDDNDGLISLAVRDGSLRQVVAMIAETQKLNLVFAGPGDTQVTATFDRQPWETVLDSLLSASGHAWTSRGDVIFVSSLEVAEFMPPDAGGQQVEVFELDFASAIDVDQTIKGLLSSAGRSWVTESDSKDNRRTKEAVAVIDYPAYLARISQYICQADQPPRQVFIQAHILQVELTDKCKNGVNFENIISLSSADITLQSLGFANTEASQAFLVDADGVGLDGLVELLQTTNDAKTLASPEIHCVSGEYSKLQIGEQLPYRSTATTQTAALESVQFLDVGVVLEVTPRVTRDGRVLMRIKPEVSSGAFLADAGGLPSKKTSQVETDVLMRSGQGIVIGGLIQETDNNSQLKIPFLGSIPYLGVLFQKRDVELSRKEIIITLRPYVLPYTPIIATQLNDKVFRAEQPLTQGAIWEYPRPYEAKMKDALLPHQHKLNAQAAPGFAPASYSDGELLMFPPIDGDVIEEIPVEEIPGGIEELPGGALMMPSSVAPTQAIPADEQPMR